MRTPHTRRNLWQLKEFDSVDGKGQAEEIVGDPVLLEKVPNADAHADQQTHQIPPVELVVEQLFFRLFFSGGASGGAFRFTRRRRRRYRRRRRCRRCRFGILVEEELVVGVGKADGTELGEDGAEDMGEGEDAEEEEVDLLQPSTE